MAKTHFDFSGRTVIVTGAARGIGFEVARAFADSGAATYVVDFDSQALAEAAATAKVRTIQADVTNTGQVNAAVEQVIAETGSVDVLVNNAGVLRDKVLWKLEDDDWETVMATHAGGTFKFSRAVVPHMRKAGFGRIINITSYSALRGTIGQANYSTAKAGIIGFTRTAAKELARFGITVNAISPNAATRMTASIPAEKYAAIEELIPMGRFAEPSEIAPPIQFLASAEAGYITGIVMPVDGGVSI